MSARSRLALAVMAAALVVPAAPAAAKGIASVSVCGAEGCTMVAHAERGTNDCPACSAEEILTELPGTAYPTRRAPWVRVILAFGAPGEPHGSERVLYAPELRLAARSNGHGDWAWFEPSPVALEIVERLVRGIAPYPAAAMPLGIDPPSVPTTPTQGPPAADSGDAPLLAGGAAAILALLLGVAAFTTRRRRRRAPVLGSAT